MQGKEIRLEEEERESENVKENEVKTFFFLYLTFISLCFLINSFSFYTECLEKDRSQNNMYISIHNFTFLCSLYNLEDGGGKKKTNRKGKEEMPNEPVYTQKKCHMAQK